MYYLRKKRFAYYAIKRTQIGKGLKYFMKYMKLSLICHISEFRRPFHPGVLSVSLSKQFLNRYDFTARVFQITSQMVPLIEQNECSFSDWEYCPLLNLSKNIFSSSAYHNLM